MAVDAILAAALSGLQTSQTGLTTVSNNIANVNTPGFAREVVNQAPVVVGGVGEGVSVADIQRVTNQFLESANYQAASDAGSAGIISNLLTQAQGAFGDPSLATSYLNQLSSVFADFTAAANDPASSLPRSQTIADLTSFLNHTQAIAGTLSGLDTQADTQINSDIAQINQLLAQINTINGSIASTTTSGGSAAGSQDSQSLLLQQLSSLIAINVTSGPNGTTVVRSSTGQLLVGDGGAATLSYAPSVSALGSIQITPAADPTSTTTLAVGSGELQGLLTLRNQLIPGIQQQLGNYVSGAASAINAAHNANTTAPPQVTLTGRNTGLDLPTIIGDFTGKTNVAIVDSTGQLTRQVAIDFTADTVSVNGGAATAFTPGSFLTALNTALGGTGTASFANGTLTLAASAAGSGVAIADDPTTPARDGGQGFSQFLGLNDLITSGEITNYNTGLKATDASGFTPGGTITLEVADASGAPISQVTVTVPPAGQPTVQDLINALNAPVGGLGLYGAFSLDANGALTFKPNSAGATLSVVADNTQRGAGGPSLTQLFGIGVAQQAGRATAFQVRPDIAANPLNLALAQLDLAAAPANPVVAVGDGSGATALARAAAAPIQFAAAGALPAQTTSVTQYAAILGGAIGQQASSASEVSTAASAVQTEARTRLQSDEGVNLDEELINLSTFQQAYNASARLVQASRELLNTLLAAVN